MNSKPNAIEILCDSASGIYIPQRFANEINRDLVSGISAVDWEILESGPSHLLYWDTWDRVEQNAELALDDGDTLNRYRLHQDGDLFAVCFDLLTDAEYSELFCD